MAISGLVLTLTDNDDLRARTLQLLPEMPELSLGTAVGVRLPVVADTPHRSLDRALFERLQAMPGVLFAEVAYVWFDDERSAAMTANALSTSADAATAERDGSEVIARVQ